MRAWSKIIAVTVGLCALAVAGAFVVKRDPSLFFPRYSLKLATGPIGSDGQKVLAAVIRDLSAEHPLLRLVPVPMASLLDAGKALTEGRVDLAVVRSTDAAAADGRTIFVLRQDGLAVILPPESKIENVSELVGKKLAVAKGADPNLLKAFVEFYGLRDIDLTEMHPEQVGAALKARRAVGAIVTGPLGPGATTDVFAAIRKTFKAKPSYLDIAEADAIAARWPTFRSVEIKPGTYGGSPTEPDEEIHTFAVRSLLISRASLSDRIAGELTRLMLTTKAKLVAALPAAGQMEAPETERSSLLPVHPGTLAYLNGEQESLLDQTVNYYWLGVMVFALSAPLLGWMASRKRLRRNEEARAKLLRLAQLSQLVKVGSATQLTTAIEELDRIDAWLFEKLAGDDIERDHFQFVEQILSQLRSSIEKRFTELAAVEADP